MVKPLPPPPLNFPSCKIAKLAIPQLPKHDSTARMASKETQERLKARICLLFPLTQQTQPFCCVYKETQVQEDKKGRL
ncbi:hypothetical protein Tco_0057272, partial [Tanacetum coccineum]